MSCSAARDILQACIQFKLTMIDQPLEEQQAAAQEVFDAIKSWAPTGNLREEMYPSAYARWRKHLASS